MSTPESLEFIEQDISYLKGRIDALENLVTLLIATHPQAGKISEVFKAKSSQIAGLEHPTVFLQAYADGVSRLAYDLDPQKIIEAFQQEEMLFLQSTLSRHH
ncbi:hypothetical protein [Comamonas resistens]|uniref:hypothetical protein n=1 Tax=Comamonas resistens TaxID=3046670 RepID=UPI0039BD4A09